VNFALVGDAIVVRTAAGSKLDAALANAVVAFEVDSIDAVPRRAGVSPPRGWRIHIDLVSGRRLVQPPPSQGTA
jgi:hypothetical protein